ncbi:MAG: ABC transporter ATP-binding protein [Clostridiales bacterium]|jgi:oligopeptide/dipeptide ABC transporter ATP-binding protein|nr:ABC transporter ATP-binding protein [Clostridiales bacterium]
MSLLDIKNLRTVFHTVDGTVRAVDGVDLMLHRGEIVAVVGESGCGKTTMGLSIMGLTPSPAGHVCADYIRFNEKDLLGLSKEEVRKIRGNEISMIFQDALSAFNPAYTVGKQITEPLRIHHQMDFAKARLKGIEMLTLVSMHDPVGNFDRYPHQLSAGMRQRALIAMALSCSPSLVIADEPTTALDVTTQAQILDLLQTLCRDLSMSVLFITHDLSIVAEIADRAVVMYAGLILENAYVEDLFVKPLHPYTQGLIASLPHHEIKRKRLSAIAGAVPNPIQLPAGCRFHPRCPNCMPICRQQEPALKRKERGEVRCWLYADEVRYE